MDLFNVKSSKTGKVEARGFTKKSEAKQVRDTYNSEAGYDPEGTAEMPFVICKGADHKDFK